MKNKRKGYTLPELMVVAAVVSAIVASATVGALRYRQNADDARMQAELQSIYKAMEAYRLVYGRYPTTYGELSGFISVPNFDQRYTLNPNPGGG